MLVAIVGKSRTGHLERWILHVNVNMMQYMNKMQKCNLCSICPETHIGDCIGDGSWCSHVDDDSS